MAINLVFALGTFSRERTVFNLYKIINYINKLPKLSPYDIIFSILKDVT